MRVENRPKPTGGRHCYGQCCVIASQSSDSSPPSPFWRFWLKPKAKMVLRALILLGFSRVRRRRTLDAMPTASTASFNLTSRKSLLVDTWVRILRFKRTHRKGYGTHIGAEKAKGVSTDTPREITKHEF